MATKKPETKKSVTKKAPAKKLVAKPSKAAKPAGKPATKASAKVAPKATSSNGVSAAQIIVSEIAKQHLTDREIVEKVLKSFPTASTTTRDVSYYRSCVNSGKRHTQHLPAGVKGPFARVGE